MTTTPAPEPRYVTTADLEAFEGRLINRMTEMELRLVRDLGNQWRWTVGLVLPIYAGLIAILIFLYTVFLLNAKP